MDGSVNYDGLDDCKRQDEKMMMEILMVDLMKNYVYILCYVMLEIIYFGVHVVMMSINMVVLVMFVL